MPYVYIYIYKLYIYIIYTKSQKWFWCILLVKNKTEVISNTSKIIIIDIAIDLKCI